VRVVLVVLALTGCSLLGAEGSFPDGQPHGGTGTFRLLAPEEVGGLGAPPGRAVNERMEAIEAVAAPVGDTLFYTARAPLAEPADPPEGFPEDEVFPGAFGPRRIRRGARRPPIEGAEASFGFDAGPVVLEAAEAWEGGEVFDPWALARDGGVLLYYAAAGGIGVAVAASAEGAFARVGDGLLVATVDGDVPTHPSAVVFGDGVLLFVSAGGGVHVAEGDGRAFGAFRRLGVGPPDPDPDLAEEVALGAPGAVRVVSPAGVERVRVYVESIREGGARVFDLLGTDDGVSFVRLGRAVAPQTNLRGPAPEVFDARRTVLFASAPFRFGGLQRRAPVALMTPGGSTFLLRGASESP
jgi:hypothetical protein